MMRYGETAPADCLVLKSNQCRFIEAAVTGEAEDVPKSPVASESDLEANPDPFIWFSSSCSEGEVHALVLAVGKNTMIMRNGA